MTSNHAPAWAQPGEQVERISRFGPGTATSSRTTVKSVGAKGGVTTVNGERWLPAHMKRNPLTGEVTHYARWDSTRWITLKPLTEPKEN